MLNKRNRISDKQIIQKLFTKGNLYRDKYFIFKYIRSDSTNSEFAVIVSKKISKKAVKRNKVRRQVFEAIRLNLNLTSDLSAVIIAKTSVQEVKYEKINDSIVQFFNQIKLHAK